MTSTQFSKLYNEHYGTLYYWVLGLVKNTAIAQDIASQTFLKAWEHRGQLTGNFKSWVYQIAANEAKNFHRRESYLHMEPLDEHQDRPDGRDFIQELERYEELARIGQAAKLLNRMLRHAIACHLRGLSIKETAERMNVPAGTAGRRINDAKRKVRILCAAEH